MEDKKRVSPLQKKKKRKKIENVVYTNFKDIIVDYFEEF